MKTPLLSLPFSCLLLLCQGAGAQSAAPALPRVVPDASGGEAAAEAFRKLPLCSLAPGGKRLLVEPCRPAPARNPMPRRPVPQTILTLPPPSANGPALRPPLAVSPPVPAVPGAPAAAPPLSQPLRQCDAAGCRDAGGTRYQGSGPVVLDPSGRPCRTDGHWVQC